MPYPREFDEYHILRDDRSDAWLVKGYDTYPAHSVLAGQTRIVFLDRFDTLERAQQEYPQATVSNKYLEPVNTFDHLDDREGSW